MDSKTGDIAWLDLTVDDAPTIKNFYQQVIGWKSDEVSMGDYSDFAMINSNSGEAVSGICHAKGANADLPAMWLPYFLVDDVEKSAGQVVALGGEMVTDIKSMGKDKYAVVKDPAGAACALYQRA